MVSQLAGSSGRRCCHAIGLYQLRTLSLHLPQPPQQPPTQLRLPFSRIPTLTGAQRPLQCQQMPRQPQQSPRNSSREGRVRSIQRPLHGGRGGAGKRVITMLACQPSTLTQRSMHHQKSSSDSPFQANTATPRRRGASVASAEFGRALSCLANSGKPQTRGPRGHAEIKPQPTTGSDLFIPP